jgi:tRNA1Val (adenine37-N6)-methyltransferase
VSGGQFTLDGFLDGRLLVAQPRSGFRAGHDTVLLAAAITAGAGARVLELGAGAGVASLCLAARVPGVDVLGIEIDPELVRLANENAARNAMEGRVRFECHDVLKPILTLSLSKGERAEAYDHVFFNPPFHPVTGQESPSPAKSRAMLDKDNAVGVWTQAALAAVKSGGTVTAILRADRVEDMLAAAEGHGAVLFPLYPHAGEVPKRVIIQLVKDAPAGLRTAAGLVLHEPDGRNSDAAEAVLRQGAALRLV